MAKYGNMPNTTSQIEFLRDSAVLLLALASGRVGEAETGDPVRSPTSFAGDPVPHEMLLLERLPTFTHGAYVIHKYEGYK